MRVLSVDVERRLRSVAIYQNTFERTLVKNRMYVLSQAAERRLRPEVL
jgi:hypothetical protein